MGNQGKVKNWSPKTTRCSWAPPFTGTNPGEEGLLGFLEGRGLHLPALCSGLYLDADRRMLLLVCRRKGRGERHSEQARLGTCCVIANRLPWRDLPLPENSLSDSMDTEGQTELAALQTWVMPTHYPLKNYLLYFMCWWKINIWFGGRISSTQEFHWNTDKNMLQFCFFLGWFWFIFSLWGWRLGLHI